jgi:hypothetical protein
VGNVYYRCEHRQKGHRAHLFLRNLQEIDGNYLEALLSKDLPRILQYEFQAQANGYGPLVACDGVATPSEQKTLCCMFTSLFFEVFLKYFSKLASYL